MVVVRILALSLAYAAGLLFAGIVLVVDGFLYRGAWLPVAYALSSAVLVWSRLGRRLAPSAGYQCGALVAGVIGLWAMGLPPDILQKAPLLGTLITLGLTWLGAILLVAAHFIGLRLKRPHMLAGAWLTVGIVFSLLVAYFSGNTGKAGPMIDWFSWLGLTAAQAEEATLYIRKAVHFTGYGTVALVSYLAALRSGIDRRGSLLFAVSYGLLLAAFDEARQAGSVHRTGSAWDVLLDLAGMACFLALAYRYVSYTASS